MSAVSWFAAWPVLDDSVPAEVLAEEARPELVEQVARTGWLPVGPPVWHVREGRVIGTECPSGLWLCVEVPVARDPTAWPALRVVPDPMPEVASRSAARSLETMSRTELRVTAERVLADLTARYGRGSPQVRTATARWRAALAAAPEPGDLLDVVVATREVP